MSKKTNEELYRQAKGIIARKKQLMIDEGIMYKINKKIDKFQWIEGIYKVQEDNSTLFGVYISQDELLEKLQALNLGDFELYRYHSETRQIKIHL